MEFSMSSLLLAFYLKLWRFFYIRSYSCHKVIIQAVFVGPPLRSSKLIISLLYYYYSEKMEGGGLAD